MSFSDIPDLTFPMVPYGRREVPWDLLPLLYRGGAAAVADNVQGQISGGRLGFPILERLHVVRRLHEEIAGDLAAGGSRHSAKNRITALRQFFAWADEQGKSLNMDTVTEAYFGWADSLIVKSIGDSSKQLSSFDRANRVSTLLDRLLSRKYPIIKETRLRSPKEKGKFGTSTTDKASVAETFVFGSLVADLCEGLSTEIIRGTLPVQIDFRQGGKAEFWSRLPKPGAKTRTTQMRNTEAKTSEAKRLAWIADKSLKTRAPLVNLRLEAELLFFIAQTGMNLEQARTLSMQEFHYTSHLDGYEVRSYKARRGGEVMFVIFNEYRAHFERFLRWRSDWFTDQQSNSLFPFVGEDGKSEAMVEFHQVRRLCKDQSISYCGPRVLRKARVNWLLRNLDDPQKVAAMAQHDLKTLLRTYAEPNPQVAMAEISRFHQSNDLALEPPGPGVCVGAQPLPNESLSTGAPAPDCSTSAGCLFCQNHRDIDSNDHVWSLVTYRHMKTLELSHYRPPVLVAQNSSTHPAEVTIDRLTQKLRFFEESSAVRGSWVKDGLMRVEEGDYHSAWDGFIRLFEVQEEL